MIGGDSEKFWSTIEPQHLVEAAHPDLVNAFRESKVKPKKATKRGSKKTAKADVEALGEILANTSISEPKTKKTKKTAVKTKKIDTYLKQAVINTCNKEAEVCASSTPKKPNKRHNYLAINLSDDENVSDLSDIIDGIVSQKPVLLENLDEYRNEDCDFFSVSYAQRDVFEKTFGELTTATNDSDELIQVNSEYSPEKEDSYSDVYIPLIERIRPKQKANFI